MIRKLLYTTFLAAGLLSSLMTNAQCTPDKNLTTPGVYPTTFTSTCENQQMDQTLQVVIPANANQLPDVNIPVAVDSFEVTSVENLPNGITYNCASPNCKVIITDPNNVSNTCISFTGTPTSTFDGNIIVNVSFYTSLGVITQKHNIAFKVLAANSPKCLATNINDIVNEKTINVYPNPSNGVSTIDLNIEGSANVQAIIYNAIGNQTAVLFDGNTSSTTLTTPTLSQGIYFVQVVINGTAHLEKLIIK